MTTKTHGSQSRFTAIPPTEVLRHGSGFLKTTAVVVIVAFLSLTLQPLAIAVQLPDNNTPAKPQSNEEKLAKTLETIEERLDKLETKLTKKQDARQEKDDLKRLRQSLDDLDRQAITDFDKIGQHIKSKDLPQVILDRHTQAVNTYQTEMAALKANLDDLEKAPRDEDKKLKALKAKEHLKTTQKKRGPKTKFDPNDLPNKSLQPNPNNKPKLTKEALQRAALFDNPNVRLAALGDFKYDKLQGASDPAYLAATTEVVLTDAIKAKAQELGYDPVKIYQWVRNSVEWLPTFGAAQDAEVTLGSQRGNAMDIASLTIALLRASGIPARYVHGTIEVPEDKFRNWAGGFNSIRAAGDYASSGGIPITSVISGGKITKVQMEHVWVEAAIDFQPSRGAINKSADSWVQLDPSYKQYEFMQGLDVLAISGIDATGLVQSFVDSGTVNETEAWVQNLSPTVLQNAQSQAQTALNTYIDNNMPNATARDVTGGRRIISEARSLLAAALPYRSLLIGARYGKIPAPLQHTMTFAFGIDPIGEPVNSVTFPWSRLNNHNVTLSFRPATAADEQALAALLPAAPITDESQLPSGIPSYLVYVVPELAVDGLVVGQGNAMRLGEDLNFYYGIDWVNGGSHSYTYAVVAGSYLAVAVVGGSVSAAILDTARTKLERLQKQIASSDASILASLSREEVLSEMFHVGTLGYFGQYLALSNMAAQPQRARHALPSAYGTYGYEPDVNWLFGLPRAINPGGIGVNVRLAWVVQPLDDSDAKDRLSLGLQTGMLSSALEHLLPEQMFSDPSVPAQGVSAVKALQIANAQGQRIYHITADNQASIVPQLHLDGLALSEITQSLAVGKEVITHTDRITVDGWTGEGYIMFDPDSGGGAYKITGGSNGGFFKKLSAFFNKALFWAGAFKSVTAKHPEMFKVLTGPIGYIIGAALLISTVLEECASKDMAYMYAGIMLAYNLIIFGLTVLLAGTLIGVALGPLIMWAAIALEWLFEYWLKSQVLQSPLCRK